MAKHPRTGNTCSASESSTDVKKRLTQPTLNDFLLLKAQKGIRKSKGVGNQNKKSEAIDLSSLLESLPVSKATRQHTSTSVELDGKSTKRTVLNGRKVKMVLCHPAFLSADGLAAILQHLRDNAGNKPERMRRQKCKSILKAMKKSQRQERQEKITHSSEGELLKSIEKMHL